MINLYDKDDNIIKYTITKFPDKTQQAWKIEEVNKITKVTWLYEDDSELLLLIQLLLIRGNYLFLQKPSLHIPFFPHARQDKQISNENTFSKVVICDILKHYEHLYSHIETVDVHSTEYFENFKYQPINIKQDFITKYTLNPDLICFPDKGASGRGYNTHEIPYFSLDKSRNQLTGEITGLLCSLPLDLKNKTILIVDDICDGGKTFIEASKVLKQMGAKNVDLYTSHGIYSKGTQVLKDSGIRNIYNREEQIV